MVYHWDVSGDDNGTVTEVVYLPVRTDIPPSKIAQTLHQTLLTITTQPGSLKTYHSPITESPSTYEFHTQWASLAHHQAFMNSPMYASFYRDVCEILDMDKGVVMWHFRGISSWRSGGEGRCMEIATFYCKKESGFLGKLRAYAARLEKEDIDGCLGACVGTVLENISPDQWLKHSVSEATKGKGGAEGEGYPEVFVLMIEWVRIGKHLKFRETRFIGRWWDVGGYEDFEMHHVEFKEFKG